MAVIRLLGYDYDYCVVYIAVTWLLHVCKLLLNLKQALYNDNHYALPCVGNYGYGKWGFPVKLIIIVYTNQGKTT